MSNTECCSCGNRFIEQEKFRLFSPIAPLLAKYVQVDMNTYSIARRGQDERMQKREERIIKGLSKNDEDKS